MDRGGDSTSLFAQPHPWLPRVASFDLLASAPAPSPSPSASDAHARGNAHALDLVAPRWHAPTPGTDLNKPPKDTADPPAAGFVAPGGGPTIEPLGHIPFEVDRAKIARLLVRDLVAKRVDMIKVWVDERRGTRPKLPPEIYRAIIDEAQRLGFHSLIAGTAEGSDASLHLNKSFGFEVVGTFKQVGRKFGKLLDVTYLQKILD